MAKTKSYSYTVDTVDDLIEFLKNFHGDISLHHIIEHQDLIADGIKIIVKPEEPDKLFFLITISGGGIGRRKGKAYYREGNLVTTRRMSCWVQILTRYI